MWTLGGTNRFRDLLVKDFNGVRKDIAHFLLYSRVQSKRWKTARPHDGGFAEVMQGGFTNPTSVAAKKLLAISTWEVTWSTTKKSVHKASSTVCPEKRTM